MLERLAPPTMQERATAALAARALRAALADPSTMGEAQVMHLVLSRPRRGVWITTWANLPGFTRTIGPGKTAAVTRYVHDSLPGWDYARGEILAEMVPDLEVLAERGIRPSAETAAAGADCGAAPLPLFAWGAPA